MERLQGLGPGQLNRERTKSYNTCSGLKISFKGQGERERENVSQLLSQSQHNLDIKTWQGS